MRRISRTFHSDRRPGIKGKQTQLQADLHAKSNKTGLIHTFGNVAGWEQAIQIFESKLEAQKAQLYSIIPFYEWLKERKLNQAHCCKSIEHGCRFANPAYGPLTIVGSISDGGRFNIGAAQMNPNFPDLNKQGALYLSNSEACAMAEASKPIGKHQLYKIRAKTKLQLWDLNQVMADLPYPSLFDLVMSDTGERIWAYQKIPTISQVLASYLRLNGGDGLISASTKTQGEFNIVLFCRDDAHVTEIVEVT